MEDRKLKVEGSDWAVLLVAASFSFNGQFTKPLDSKKDPTLEALNLLTSISKLAYSNLYTHHLDDYRKLFHRVLDMVADAFSAEESIDMSTKSGLMIEFKSGLDSISLKKN